MAKITNRILVIALVLSLVLTGCIPQHERVIDQLAIFIGLGVDVQPDNPDVYILTTSNPTFSDRAEEPALETTTMGYGFEGALRNWEYQRQNRFALGKVATVIFGEDLTKQGLRRALFELRQVEDMNILAQAVYYPGSPQEAWEITPPEEARRAVFLLNQLERLHEEGLIPRVSVCGLNSMVMNPDIDGYLPQLELTESKERFHITGLALLDMDGKLVTVLSKAEMILFLILTNDAIGAFNTTDVKVQGKEGNISFVIKGHRTNKTHVTLENGKPQIVLTIPLEIEVLSMRIDGIEALSREFIQEMQRELSRDLTVQIQELIEKLQELEVDPVGIGQWVRIQQIEYYKGGTWRDDYPTADIRCNVEVNLSRINIVTEKP